MKEKLKPHFLAFGPRRFVIFTVISLLITDLINTYYLKLWWIEKKISELMVFQSIKRSGYTEDHLSAATIGEMKAFIDNGFFFFLLIILANNAFFYLFYLRKKLWAQGYVLFYALTAALFALSFIIDDGGLGWKWKAYNLLTIPYYIYVFLGVKLLKSETTLAGGKKER